MRLDRSGRWSEAIDVAWVMGWCDVYGIWLIVAVLLGLAWLSAVWPVGAHDEAPVHRREAP